MIQRIQSIFLAIVMVVMIWFCFTTIWVKSNDQSGDEIIFKPTSITHYNGSMDANTLSNLTVNEYHNWHIVALAAFSIFFAGLMLFSYKKRVRQMKLGFLNGLILVILLALEYYHIMQADHLIPNPQYGEYKLGFFLPVLALILTFMANYYIKKDEDLVRSADRLR